MAVGDIGPQLRVPQEVYALRDPRTDEARYVGVGTSAGARLVYHVSNAARYVDDQEGALPKDHWLVELRRLRLRPSLEVLQTGVPWEQRQGVEAQWVEAFAEAGHRLTNRAKWISIAPEPTWAPRPGFVPARLAVEGAARGAGA
jgi:hypothetical protein